MAKSLSKHRRVAILFESSLTMKVSEKDLYAQEENFGHTSSLGTAQSSSLVVEAESYSAAGSSKTRKKIF